MALGLILGIGRAMRRKRTYSHQNALLVITTRGRIASPLVSTIAKNGQRIKNYRGMGSLEAMTKGSDARYVGETAKLKIAQGVVGAVANKGSVLNFLPYIVHAIKQGFQDLGASSLESTHHLLRSSTLRLEVQTGAAQIEGGVHGLVSYEKKAF
ncbi:IMPDH domain-containing protein [Cephalotus follicularis]|uniref:IMPDH domain-containing protein n=1 Tax=Cephalotus follicularis TaxID=3775 RepID=A0A1Q3D715_CEPFO|nr:IMPDH domain-containing protein [Cephalotus follicularis]